MDHGIHIDEESAIDLECGETLHETNIVSDNKEGSLFLNKVYGGLRYNDGSGKGDNVVSYCNNLENVKFFINQKVYGKESVSIVENKRKDGRKSTSAKRPPKPPRPPRGLSLDAADQKLIKEIAELAMLKRARIERMKALKKMKAAKAQPSSNGSLFAMLFTFLFCLVIIFQGMSSQSWCSIGFHGSMQSAGAPKISLNLVQDHLNSSTRIFGSETLKFSWRSLWLRSQQ